MVILFKFKTIEISSYDLRNCIFTYVIYFSTIYFYLVYRHIITRMKRIKYLVYIHLDYIQILF